METGGRDRSICCCQRRDLISKMQRELLNPTLKQVVRGFVMCDAKGKGAMQKVARCRLDFIGGNIKSCSQLLNSWKRLEDIKEANELVAAVASVAEENEKEKKRKRQDKEDSDKAKARKKEEAKAKFCEEQRALMPSLSVLVQPFIEDPLLLLESKFTAEQLTQLAKCHFENMPKGFSSLKKSEKHQEVKAMVEEAHRAPPAAAAAAPEQFRKQQSVWCTSVTQSFIAACRCWHQRHQTDDTNDTNTDDIVTMR